jgi:hypothetical protein
MTTTARSSAVRLTLLLSLIGGCYWLGQWYSEWQAANQVAVATPKPSPASPLSAQTSGSVDAVMRLFADSSISTHDKYGHFLDMIRTMNPNQLVELVKKLEGLPGLDQKYLTASFSYLSSRAPALALTLIDGITDAKEKWSITMNSLVHLSMKDPRQAVSELEKLPPTDGNPDFDLLVYSALAKTNLAAAQAEASSLPEGVDRVGALQGVGRSMALSDPQGAINWAQSLSSDNQSVLETVLIWVGAGGLLGGNPTLAVPYLDDLTDPAARNDVILRISASWGGASQNPTAALTWLNQVATGDTYSTAVNNIISGLTGSATNQQNIPAAVALLANITDPAVRENAISMVAGNWSATDRSSAMAWAQTLPSADSSVALNSIVSSWAKNDAAAALAFVQNSADPSAYLPSAPNVAKALAASDPQDALAFAQSLPAGTAQTQALNNVLTTVAQSNFTDAWNTAASLPPGNSQDTIMTNLVGVEAGKDPAQAAALLNQISDPATQLAATSSLSTIWISQDPQAFTTWLTGLPEGDVRDAAIQQLVSSSQATKNPAGVLQWVNTVSNPQLKSTLLQKLGQN